MPSNFPQLPYFEDPERPDRAQNMFWGTTTHPKPKNGAKLCQLWTNISRVFAETFSKQLSLAIFFRLIVNKDIFVHMYVPSYCCVFCLSFGDVVSIKSHCCNIIKGRENPYVSPDRANEIVNSH